MVALACREYGIGSAMHAEAAACLCSNGVRNRSSSKVVLYWLLLLFIMQVRHYMVIWGTCLQTQDGFFRDLSIGRFPSDLESRIKWHIVLQGGVLRWIIHFLSLKNLLML